MAKRKEAFGSRLRNRGGISVRKKWSQTTAGYKKPSVCPSCGMRSARRQSVGIWKCERCGHVFAGGAYSLRAQAP